VQLGQEVGLPIDPPKRNVNSRFALETAELVRVKEGDDAVGVFYQDVSRAFFTKQADISKREVIAPAAERFRISAPQVEEAWNEHRFSRAVDTFVEEGTWAALRRSSNGMAASARDRWNDAGGRSRASTSKRRTRSLTSQQLLANRFAIPLVDSPTPIGLIDSLVPPPTYFQSFAVNRPELNPVLL
jgi:hypothetical protein